MKKRYLSLIMIVLAFVMVAQSKVEQLHGLLESYAAINKVNGAVLIVQNDNAILNQAYGDRNITQKLPNEPNTIFQVGSLTKQFTATVILKLQEMEELNVRDKISKYFPDFPNGDLIQIEHLITHTSGIFNYTDDKEFMQTQAFKPLSQEQMISTFKEKPLKFVPGSDWEYSNSNYVLLGYIIEKVTNKTYEQVVQNLILTPLNMNDTGFKWSNDASDNLAKGYSVYTKEESKESVEFDPSVSYAAGSMYTTTGDLYKYQKGMSLNKIIQKASYDKANTPFKNKYGYGNYIDQFDNKKYTAHGGLTFGFTSYLGRLEADGVSIIILNNIVNYAINDIAKDVLAILYDKPYKLPEAIKEITLSTEILEKYIGTYEVSPQFLIVISLENGQLYGQATGQGKVGLTAQKEDSFFLKGTDVTINFNKDVTDIIQELILVDGGQEIPAKKMY